MDSAIGADHAEFRRRRWAGAKWTSLTSVVQIVAAAVMQLVLFGVASRSLSNEQFGVWTAVATLSTLLGLTDFGLSKAATNLIASSASPNETATKQVVSAAFFSQSAICLLAGAVLIPLVGVLPWADFFRLKATDPQVPRAIQLVILLALATAPFNVARSAVQGTHQGWLSSAWDFTGSLAGIIVALSMNRANGLVWMAAVSSVAPVVGRVLCAGWLMLRVTPSWKSADWQTALELWRTGRHFLVAQASELVFQQSQPWMVSHFIGSAVAGGFVGAARLVTMPYLLALVTANSLIPAYADAQARRDRTWMRLTLKRTAAAAAFVSFTFGAIFFFLLGPILHAWLGSKIPVPDPSTRLWLIGAAVVQALATPMWALLYGAGRVSLPARLSMFSTGIWLAGGSICGLFFGQQGLAIALCLAPLFCQLLPLTRAAWRSSREEP